MLLIKHTNIPSFILTFTNRPGTGMGEFGI